MYTNLQVLLRVTAGKICEDGEYVFGNKLLVKSQPENVELSNLTMLKKEDSEKYQLNILKQFPNRGKHILEICVLFFNSFLSRLVFNQ